MSSKKNKVLDLMKTEKLVDLFISEEQKSISLLKKEKTNITKVVDLITKHMEKGGRVVYIGAGTSGRIGILDAVECRPTFSTNSFTGILAGGKNAFFNAKEGSEDNKKAAVKDLKKLKLTKNDIIIGIAASGETPYTVSAVKYAGKLGLLTVGITLNPSSTLCKSSKIKISPSINQEIIEGSSRLKSGTLQKIILNIISSVTMIKQGKVYDDLMIDVQPSNKKLIKRAIGIISSICKVPLNEAKSLFIKAGKNTKIGIIMHKKKCDLITAKELLRKNKFRLRRVIG